MLVFQDRLLPPPSKMMKNGARYPQKKILRTPLRVGPVGERDGIQFTLILSESASSGFPRSSSRNPAEPVEGCCIPATDTATRPRTVAPNSVRRGRDAPTDVDSGEREHSCDLLGLEVFRDVCLSADFLSHFQYTFAGHHATSTVVCWDLLS